MPYRIAITDDSNTAADCLSTIVTGWAHARGICVQITSFPSAEDFLLACDDGECFDVLLLDIEMGGMNGVELARARRQAGDTVQIIFVTGYPDFISEGYDVSALHYLLKPVDAEKLCAVLDRAAANAAKPARTVVLTLDGAVCRVPVEDIQYAEAFSHSVAFVTQARTYEVRMSMAEAERLLGDGFIRCHRSYLVALHALSQITKTAVTLDSGVTLPLARSAAATVHKAFIDYYRGDIRESL